MIPRTLRVHEQKCGNREASLVGQDSALDSLLFLNHEQLLLARAGDLDLQSEGIVAPVAARRREPLPSDVPTVLTNRMQTQRQSRLPLQEQATRPYCET